MLPYPVTFTPYTITRVFSITQMFIFSFLGFWLLRKLVIGHPSYVVDTDWLVRIPGAQFINFCKGPMIAFGSWLDQQIAAMTRWVVVTLRSPRIESRITPLAIGIGVLMSIMLFSILLVFRIGYY